MRKNRLIDHILDFMTRVLVVQNQTDHPIDICLKIMGQRYALHIMRNMILLKQNMFNQFLNSIEGINTKTLSIRLQKLEDYGLVERKVIPGKPAQTEYYPTEKGMAVQGILSAIASFSIKYEPDIIFVDKRRQEII